MLTATEIAGFAGAGLAGAAYVPQVSHLVRGRCSAGISRLAFAVWLLASVLTTARAIAIHAGVFIVLGGIQIVATALIIICAARYKDTPCPVHLPGRPTARTTSGPRETSRFPASGRPAAGSAIPARHGEHRVGTFRFRTRVVMWSPPRPGREPDIRVFGSQPRPQIAAAVPGVSRAGPGSSRPRAGFRTTHLKETT